MSKVFKNDISIIGGAGRVGLPLAIAFASKRKRVLIHDIDKQALAHIQHGKMPFKEDGAQPLLKQVLSSGHLSIAARKEDLSNSKNVVLVVGTPLDEHLNPTFYQTMQVIDEYQPHFVDGQVLILRSTIYPGISEKIHKHIQKSGKKIHLAFCPERIVEGKALSELSELPQIISSQTKEGLKGATNLFKNLTNKIITTSYMEAELAKLFTNTWRYIQFAAANQFFLIADSCGLDFSKIHKAMTHEYPRTKNMPMSGFSAGPCLFKDTMQLSAFHNNNFFLGHAAMLINEGMPLYMVNKLKSKFNLHNKTVGILGMAFKKDSDDKRQSLSYKLSRFLKLECHKVYCSDEFVKNANFVSKEELIKKSDIIILGAPHSAYKNLNLGKKYVVDIWNFFGKGSNV